MRAIPDNLASRLSGATTLCHCWLLTFRDGGRLGFEYLFVDAPGKPEDYKFVYETPSRVITAPLEFTFKDVPLP